MAALEDIAAEIAQVRDRLDASDDTVIAKALKAEYEKLRLKYLALQEQQDAKERQRVEEAAFYSPLGQAIKKVFDYEQYDYWEQENWPEYVRIVEETLAKHGLIIVPPK
jgi:Skp family chaperone for outer membrane proteins